jgi:hypothetical protein
MVRYGYTYTNMFGNRILIGIFNSKKEAKSHQEMRDEGNKVNKDRYPRIIEWNEENLKRYNYIYTLNPDGSKHVVKEYDEREDFIPENWEEL